MQRSRSKLALAIMLVGCASLIPALAQDRPPAVPSPQPSARIDLSSIDYHPPSEAQRLADSHPSVTVDFVDPTHLLLTFNRKKLLQRRPECSPTHDDRLMHAAILELPSGKVVHEADWYLHDRRPYLWPLGSGRFLFRSLNDLYVVDSTLHEKLLFSSPKDLLWVSVTPDARQIVLETPASPGVKESRTGTPSSRFEIQFLDAVTLAPLRTFALNERVNISATSFGYANLIHKNDIWLIRFGPDPKHRRNLARVRSRFAPEILYPSDDSLLVGRCASPQCDFSVTAFTLSGRRLWRQHWPRNRFFPTIVASQQGGRFALSTLQVNTAATAETNAELDADSLQPNDLPPDALQQQLQVFETASGNPLLSLDVNPAYIGRNFSLSPNGRKLAVLAASSLELYDLPQPSPTEQMDFATLRSEAPDYLTLASTAGSDDAWDPEPEKLSGAASAAAEDTSQPAPPEAQPTSASTAGANTPPAATANSSPATSTTAALPPAPTAPPPTIRVSTRAVVVDVVVADSKGHPIKGLQQQDFQLFEDNKIQQLRSFRASGDLDHPADSSTKLATVNSARPSPNVFTNQASAPDSPAVTLVLFDMLNTAAQDQAYARLQLIKFLQTKPKDSQFALCALGQGAAHLRLLQGFTPDETLLLAAAKQKKSNPQEARWQVSAAGTRNSVDIVTDLAQEGRTSGYQNLQSTLQQTQAEQQVTDADERSAITLDSMTQLAQYLSGIPGRKNVVWLSGSFPIAIAASNDFSATPLDNPNYYYKIKRVTNLLAEAQVAVYPVDVRGMTTGGLDAGSAGTMGGPVSIDPQNRTAASLLAPAQAVPQGLQDLATAEAERETLIAFATETGGKAFYNTNGIRDAIATATEQGSNYYTLSYSPANRNYDGKFRKIKVQLAQKGYTLYYRRGYYADDTNSAVKDAALNRRTRAVAMQHGSPLSRQLQFSAKVVPVGGKKKLARSTLGDIFVETPAASSKHAPAQSPLPAQVEIQHYNIDYTFDGSELRFVPLQNDKYRNILTLMIASYDREGKMITAVSNVGAKDLDAAVFAKTAAGEFGVQQDVDVPADAVSLRIGVQDQMSSHIGTVDVPLPVPPDPNAPRKIKRLPDIEPD